MTSMNKNKTINNFFTATVSGKSDPKRLNLHQQHNSLPLCPGASTIQALHSSQSIKSPVHKIISYQPSIHEEPAILID